MLFLDHSLCSSLQLLLVHRVSRPWMLSPWLHPQGVHSPETQSEGQGVVLPRRGLDRLRVPANKGALEGDRLAGFAQQWQNLIGEGKLSRILRSGVLLKWECHQPPLTRTPIQFPRNELQKSVDSLLEKEAIEPAHRSHSTWVRKHGRGVRNGVSSHGSVKSVVTRVSTKRIAAPWDSDHEPSPAPAKRSRRDGEGIDENRNRHSDRGQDDSRWEHLH